MLIGSTLLHAEDAPILDFNGEIENFINELYNAPAPSGERAKEK